MLVVRATVSRFSFNPITYHQSQHMKFSLTCIFSPTSTPLDLSSTSKFYGLSTGDLAHDAAEDEEQSDLQAKDLLKSMSFESPYCRQFFILNSLADAVNIPIKHLHIYGLDLLPTTAKPFASETRFMAFLQTLSVDASSLGPDGFAWTDEFHVSSGRASFSLRRPT